MFCTRGKFRFGTRAGELVRRPKNRSLTDKTIRNEIPLSAELVYSAQQYGLPFVAQNKNPKAELSAHAGGRLEIEKRSYVWRSFLKEPFGSVLSPNRSPWPGLI
jgi:hypothetical protein